MPHCGVFAQLGGIEVALFSVCGAVGVSRHSGALS